MMVHVTPKRCLIIFTFIVKCTSISILIRLINKKLKKTIILSRTHHSYKAKRCVTFEVLCLWNYKVFYYAIACVASAKIGARAGGGTGVRGGRGWGWVENACGQNPGV